MKRRIAWHRNVWQVGLALLFGVAGCRQAPQPPAYRGLVGEVFSTDLETSELFVRYREPGFGSAASGTQVCLLTPESEIFLNDRVSDLAALENGDRVEVIGHVDRANRQRLVVGTAYVTRRVDIPPGPELPVVPPPTASAAE